jgi:hypothetical protein
LTGNVKIKMYKTVILPLVLCGKTDLYGTIVLKWILAGMGLCGLDSYALEQGLVEGSCEDSNEPSGLIKCWVILQWLSDWQLLKKDSAQWN